MNANEIREEVLSWTAHLPAPDFAITKSERGFLVGLLNDALRLGASIKEANQRRREVLAWLFREYIGKPNASFLSVNDLPPECVWALYSFAEVRKDEETGRYVSGRGSFADDMIACWAAIAKWDAEMRVMCGDSEEYND
jgi:hypothetical protein